MKQEEEDLEVYVCPGTHFGPMRLGLLQPYLFSHTGYPDRIKLPNVLRDVRVDQVYEFDYQYSAVKRSNLS